MLIFANKYVKNYKRKKYNLESGRHVTEANIFQNNSKKEVNLEIGSEHELNYETEENQNTELILFNNHYKKITKKGIQNYPCLV